MPNVLAHVHCFFGHTHLNCYQQWLVMHPKLGSGVKYAFFQLGNVGILPTLARISFASRSIAGESFSLSVGRF